jgi:hypothetical protein
MKKSIVLLLTCILLSGVLYAQSVKQPQKDTAKYRANDRLRTAGPKDGWKGKSKTDTGSIKAKKDTAATNRRIDSLKKRN